MSTRERERNLEAQVEAQAKRIAELVAFSRKASKDILLREKLLLKQSAALKLSRDALQAMHSLDEENHQRYSGDTDICTETRMCREALAAIDSLQKGE